MKIWLILTLAICSLPLALAAEDRFHEITEFDKPAFCGPCHVHNPF